MQSLYGMLVPSESQARSSQQQQQQQQQHQSVGASIATSASMAPPPDLQFSSRDELLSYLKDWAATQGYAVVIGRSRTNRLWIRCDRGGEYRDKHANDPSARQRKRKESRLTGCMFSIKASMRKDGIWRSRCEYGQHNHGPSEDLRDHPSLRRMTEEQLSKVHELTGQGKTPAEIMEELHQLWPDIKVIRRDIYNARKNLKSTKDGSSFEQGDSASASTSAPPSAPPSAPASGTTSLNVSFEDPSRMSATSDSGRWPWYDDDHVVTKKRKLGPSSRGSDTTATQSFNSNAGDGPSAQLAMESLPNIPSVTSPLSDHNQLPPWPRSSFAGGPQQRPNHASVSTSGQMPSQRAEGRISSNATMRNAGPDYAGTTNHLGSIAKHLNQSSPYYSPQIMNSNRSASHAPTPPPPLPPLNPPQRSQDRRANSQVHIHPSLRNTQANSPSMSPDVSRRPSNALPNSNVAGPNTLQAPGSVNAGAPISRTMPTTPQALTSDATSGVIGQPVSAGTSSSQPQQPQHHQHQHQHQHHHNQPTTMTPATMTPAPKVQSGVAIMHRMQRMEDELREQKGMLNEILSVVQGLREGNKSAAGPSTGPAGASSIGSLHRP